MRNGFAVTAQKTVAVSPDRLFDAFVDATVRERWLPGAALRERTATRPKSARFDWGNGETRLNVTVEHKGDGKTTVAVEHARLANAKEADRMKAYWRQGLTTLKTRLEGGESDA